MCTLIIPDIHTKHRIAQRILETVTHDRAVFLGDYFDNYGDTFEMNVATAEWLRGLVGESRYDFLVGNHDMSYGFVNMRCSGWTQRKQIALSPHIYHLLVKMKAAVRVDDYVLSHAGYNQRVWDNYGIDGANKDLQRHVNSPESFTGFPNILWQPGQVVGGFPGDLGGITWLRWEEEFKPLKFKQIVGHTHGREPRWSQGNLCLDTGLHNYAVLDDGELKTFEVPASILIADRISKMQDFIK